VNELESPARPCFIARQPVFDAHEKVFGYELLYRTGPTSGFPDSDGDAASAQLIGNALTLFGFNLLTGGRKAFINLTREVLLQEHACLLPPEQTVVEILETIEPDSQVVEACQKHKQMGYLLALDDFVYDPKYEPLVGLADIIKVDFREATSELRRAYARQFAPRGIKLLAEKVETREEWREALAYGYSYFQGYFFCKPETFSRTDLPGRKVHCLRLLCELSNANVEFDRVEEIIKHDLSMATRLLAYLNSALFGWHSRVTSFRHAAVLLGVDKLRRWANLAAVAGLAEGKAPELFLTCLVRARFCELAGSSAGLGRHELDLFLVGLFSSLDAILNRPLGELLQQFGVSRDVAEALQGSTLGIGRVYSLVQSYERGDWPSVSQAALDLGITEREVANAYHQAVQWASDASGVVNPARA